MSGGSIAVEYREQAKRIRAAAEAMTLPDSRVEMLKIAAAYEQLADHLETESREPGDAPGVPKSA